jgi:hypothetical protein
MIDVRMGEHKDIDAAAVAGTPAVHFKRLLAFALEESAIKHYTVAVDVDEVLGTGYGLCSTMKCNLHFFSMEKDGN